MADFILFDLDGTLTDSKEGITKCVKYALGHFGIEKNEDELESFIGPPLKEQFMSFANLSEKEAEEAVRIYRERYIPIGIFENKVYDGVIPLLKKLKEEGKTLAIATSKPEIFARKIADKYEFSEYMTEIKGSELDGTNTDKESVIKLAMEALGAEKENTIMVGDRAHDAIGAKKAGIVFIGVSYGYAKEGELEGEGAKLIAKTPLKLYEILSGSGIN